MKKIYRNKNKKTKKNNNNKKQTKQKGGNGSRYVSDTQRHDLLKLIEVASAWNEKGQWIIDNDTIVVYDHGKYQLNDFKLFFLDNWSTGYFEDDIKLKTYAKNQYTTKNMAMNCWEFVLLCLYEAKYITKQHIITLYNHNLQREASIIPNFFCIDTAIQNPDKLVPGYIMLEYRERTDRVIYHVGIAVSEKKYIHCLNTNVGIDDYDTKYNKPARGTLIVDPKYLCSTIINLPIIENVMFNTADLFLAMLSLK